MYSASFVREGVAISALTKERTSRSSSTQYATRPSIQGLKNGRGDSIVEFELKLQGAAVPSSMGKNFALTRSLFLKHFPDRFVSTKKA